ncbi:MAG: UDP-2,4-diacetamido-2,4,6-trideoxy-beta-L-altropyranose hydrolase [Bdellovibrionales bacterium]|nr:UDP-2,4-diacetamido-2,4,6-trideoxy-beta-L-altropyranose hydrolase [Ramlibacter sp.]
MITAQRWAVRADSSLHMGAGHLMRCLTLARQARARGAAVEFICADLPGNLSALVTQQGFGLHLVRGPEGGAGPALFDGAADALQTLAVAGSRPWDWLVADHYDIDAGWETALRPMARHLLVIDDLANRQHDCDVLLDQNYYPGLEHRYDGLLPPACRKLLGPRFLLLRPEFTEARARLARSTGPVRRILINFGGTDEANVTGLALDAMALLARPEIALDVVMGATTPHRAQAEARVAALPDCCLHVQTSRMAELIASADLAIGACGSSTWERCCLGLPTLALVLADNQRQGAAALHAAGIIFNLGEAQALTPAALAAATAGLIADKAARQALSERSLALGAGTGPDLMALLAEAHT